MTDKNLPPRKRQVPTESSKQDHDDLSSEDSVSGSANSDDSQGAATYRPPSGYPTNSYAYVDQKTKRKPAAATTDSSNRQPRKAALNKKKYVDRDEDSDDNANSDDDDDDGPAPPPKRVAVAARPTNEQLYCVCRKPDHGGFMIGCDNCDEWYHGECVRINEARSKQILKYICEKCERKGSTRTEFLATTTSKPPVMGASPLVSKPKVPGVALGGQSEPVAASAHAI